MHYHRAAGRYLLVVGIVLSIGMAAGFVYALLHDMLFLDIGPILMLLIGFGVYHGSSGWRKFGIVVCLLYVAVAVILLFVGILSPDTIQLTLSGARIELDPTTRQVLTIAVSLLYLVLFGIPGYLLLHPRLRQEVQS